MHSVGVDTGITTLYVADCCLLPNANQDCSTLVNQHMSATALLTLRSVSITTCRTLLYRSEASALVSIMGWFG